MRVLLKGWCAEGRGSPPRCQGKPLAPGPGRGYGPAMSFRHLRILAAPLACACALAMAVALSGCFAPKSYTVQCRIDSTGDYRFFVEGLAVHTPTAFALRKMEQERRQGKLKEEELKKRQAEIDAGLAKQVAECLKDKRLQHMQPVGEGKVRFAASLPGTLAGRDLVRRELLAPLSLARHADGSVTVRIKDVTPSSDARALRIQPEGDIAVFVAEGVQVLAHNAARTPTTPNGAYRWSITSLDDPVPFMTLRLPGTEPPAREAPAQEKNPEKGQEKEPAKDAKGKTAKKARK